MSDNSDLALTLLRANMQLKQVAVASAALLIYDHATCLGEEVNHFWSGGWSLARVLYCSIRYLALTWALLQIFGLIAFTVDPVTYSWILLFLLVPIITLCQATITLRVWFLFYKSPMIKAFALTIFALCISATYISAGVLWNQIKIQTQALQSSESTNNNNNISTRSIFVCLYIPSLVFHSTLFALKVYRFVSSPTYMQTHTLLWRFMKEGMFMYVFAVGSLLFTIISLTMTHPDDLPTYLAAWNGCMVVTLMVISVCRAMLSIRSLAATSHVAPAWLLNHAEMSRVKWRHGTVQGEIVVEMPNAVRVL